MGMKTLALLALLAAALAPAQAGRWIQGFHGAGEGRIEYRLYLPAGYDGSTPLPLVVMLHGCAQGAADFAAGTRMHRLADQEGFLVLFPEQSAAANPQRCWNWFDPAHQRRGSGEPALLAGVTEEVGRAHGADPERVFVAGMSAGGAMAAVLAATYPGRFAAAGVHSGVGYAAAASVPEALRVMRSGPPAPLDPLGVGKSGDAPVPLIVIHGEADAVVSPANAGMLAGQWERAAGAERGEPVLGGGEGRPWARTLSRAGGAPVVEWWSVAGLGHAWSGGAPEGSFTDPRGPDASREMIRFFRETARIDGARAR